MKSFKLLGLLLTYPHAELQVHLNDIWAAIEQEDLLEKKTAHRLSGFIDQLVNRDLLGWQEEYVETFDRGRAHCLHLFEHIHGESRDRGQAMVDLAQMYESKGFVVKTGELPDFLPLFLEYLSICPFAEAQELLGEAVHVIAAIGGKLKARSSDYGHVFEVLVQLSSLKPDAAQVAAAVDAAAQEDTSLAALDKEWEEAAAFDGNPQTDCSSCDAFPNASKALDALIGGVK